MLPLVVELGVAPLLAAASICVARRFGVPAGAVTSAFPAIVGPLLLLAALQHGGAFAARSAQGTVLGLVALSGFALAYGRVATRRSWPISFAAGWAGAAAGSLLAGLGAGAAPAGTALLIAVASLAAAARGLRAGAAERAPAVGDSPAAIPLRMAATALLIVLLAAAENRLGPLAGGMLAALPVLASVLTVGAHREAGGAGAVAWLQGTLRGMVGFVCFCEVFALVIRSGGTAPALAAATAAALAVQSAIVGAPWLSKRPV